MEEIEQNRSRRNRTKGTVIDKEEGTAGLSDKIEGDLDKYGDAGKNEI